MLLSKTRAWLLGGAMALCGQSAMATDLIALSGDRTLTRVNIEQRQGLESVTVTGGAGRVLGIDVRPSNGSLYALLQSGAIGTINLQTGAFIQVSTIGPLANARYSVDFNPVADRLRVVSDGGDNLRINVDTGEITVDTDINAPSPLPFGDNRVNVVGAAYTNSAVGPAPASTLLYDIDRLPPALYLQLPPNNGTLAPVGLMNGNVGSVAFDIAVDAGGRNRGYVVTLMDQILEIDLAGGAIVSRREISNFRAQVRDIAVLPAS